MVDLEKIFATSNGYFIHNIQVALRINEKKHTQMNSLQLLLKNMSRQFTEEQNLKVQLINKEMLKFTQKKEN